MTLTEFVTMVVSMVGLVFAVYVLFFVCDFWNKKDD